MIGGLMSMVARLGIDTTPYARGLAQASVMSERWATGVNRDMASKLGRALGGVALASTAFAFVKGVADRATALKDFSEQMDTTIEETQQMELASKDVGLALNDWGVALRTVTEFRKRVAQGDAEAIRLAMKYKLNLDDVANAEVRNIEIAKQLGVAIRGMNLNARDRGELKEFFGGKAGEKFAAVLQNMGKERVLMSKEEVEDIDRAVKDLERAKVSLQASGAQFIAPYMSTLSALVRGDWKGALNSYASSGGAGGGTLAIGLRMMGFGGKTGGAKQSSLVTPTDPWGGGGGVRIAEDEGASKRETEAAEAYTKLYEAMAKNRGGNGVRELRRQLNNALVEASEFGVGEKGRAEALTRAELLRGEIAQRQRDMAGRFQGDSLTAMGNFLGDSGNAGSVMARMENELRQIKENTGRMAVKGAAGGEFPESAF